MIYYTALTYHPKYVSQYIYLLRSIGHVYPDAKPILYLFSEFEPSILEDLKRENRNLTFVDWARNFEPHLGFDTNFIRGLKHCYQHSHDPVVSLDADMLICKPFDGFLDNSVDVTVTTRGYILNELGRQDICFGVSIYSRRKPESVIAFLDNLEERALKWSDPEHRSWFEIQTELNNMFLEAEGDLLNGYQHKQYEQRQVLFPARTGRFVVNDQEIVLRAVDFILLGCSYPPRYGESHIIHYKREKANYRMLFNAYCLKKNRKLNQLIRSLKLKIIAYKNYAIHALTASRHDTV